MSTISNLANGRCIIEKGVHESSSKVWTSWSCENFSPLLLCSLATHISPTTSILNSQMFFCCWELSQKYGHIRKKRKNTIKNTIGGKSWSRKEKLNWASRLSTSTNSLKIIPWHSIHWMNCRSLSLFVPWNESRHWFDGSRTFKMQKQQKKRTRMAQLVQVVLGLGFWVSGSENLAESSQELLGARHVLTV